MLNCYTIKETHSRNITNLVVLILCTIPACFSIFYQTTMSPALIDLSYRTVVLHIRDLQAWKLALTCLLTILAMTILACEPIHTTSWCTSVTNYQWSIHCTSFSIMFNPYTAVHIKNYLKSSYVIKVATVKIWMISVMQRKPSHDTTKSTLCWWMEHKEESS